jgi:two-component system, NtrC family, nitrogen regulation sensor histidine kinase GlnL
MTMVLESSYLNALPSALIAVDKKLAIAFVNPAAEMFFGISAQQATGRHLSAFPGMDEAMCELAQRVLDSCEAISLFEHVIRLPGNHRTVTMHLSPVMETAGEGRLTTLQLLITLEKSDGLDRLATSEWKQEATRAAGVMAAMLAHEVKNPLSGIRGAAQLLQEEVTPEQQALTELICLETDRIRDLLNQVEIFAGGMPGPLQPVNIHEVLQYVISIARTGPASQVAFREVYDPSLPSVLGHRDLLIQLFLNLVKNSAEAMAGKPEARITISTTYRSGYRFSLGKSQEKVSLPVMVSIEDNGTGIAEEVRNRLFEPFVSSKQEGRGLGLAIVAKIASDLGAVVELDRDCDSGARFVVSMACVT